MVAPLIIDTTGTKLYIATTQADLLPAESPNPWTEVGEVESFGEITFAANEVRSTAIGRIYDTVNKGVIPSPVVAISFNKLASDTGQAAMLTAFNNRTDDQYYWFKLDFPDLPTGGVNPTRMTFHAKVMSFTPLTEIAVDGTVKGSTSVAIDLETFVETAAA